MKTFRQTSHKSRSAARPPNWRFDDIRATTNCPENDRWSKRHFRKSFHRRQNLSAFFVPDHLRCSTQRRIDRRRRWKSVGESTSAKCLDLFCRLKSLDLFCRSKNLDSFCRYKRLDLFCRPKCRETFCRPKRDWRRCSWRRIRRKIFRRLLTFDKICFCGDETDPKWIKIIVVLICFVL